MLAFALRRAIWAIPTLFGVSLVVFLLTTLLPEPEDDAPGIRDLDAQLRFDELRRARFLDLPRLLNVTPSDVHTKTDEYVAHLVKNDEEAALSGRRLAEIGGAALPYLLPRLDDVPPAARGRVALALAPIARRMGLGEEPDLTEPDRAVLFWQRFWEDRSVDFTEPAVRRSVQRLTLRASEQREADLLLVDTFALKELLDGMHQARDTPTLARLTRIAAHVTGRDAIVLEDDSRAQTRAIVSGWFSWWYVHETDYVPLRGGEKVTSSIVQTRYAKWVLGAVTGQLGLSTRDGVPVFDKLLDRAPVTLGMAWLALLVSVTASIPLGVASAWRRGRTIDIGIGLTMLAIYCVPTFLVAEVFAALEGSRSGFVLPVLALATVSVSATTGQQRASMIDALSQDYVRTAQAKGARTLRIAIVHALRNALVPTVTLAGVQYPALVGGAFVVEEVFDIRGIGWETLRAIESRDAAWIVAVTLLSAVVTTICLVGSDIAYGLLDPRVRERQTRRRTA